MTLRQREGDQRLPIGNALPSMHHEAIVAMNDRKNLGIARYGQPLQPANGRDAALDVFEECLDGAAYGAQVVWEQSHPEHTYVGVLIEGLAGMQNNVEGDEVILNFKNMFVPSAVIEMLDRLSINYFVLGSD